MLRLAFVPCVLSLQLGSVYIAPRASVRVPYLTALVKEEHAALADTMLTLIDQWAIDDEISKPFAEDKTADACMVPIELEWLNAKICELTECPLDLPEAFESAWDRVKFKGEGCVTVNSLKEEIRAPSS